MRIPYLAQNLIICSKEVEVFEERIENDELAIEDSIGENLNPLGDQRIVEETVIVPSQIGKIDGSLNHTEGISTPNQLEDVSIPMAISIPNGRVALLPYYYSRNKVKHLAINELE